VFTRLQGLRWQPLILYKLSDGFSKRNSREKKFAPGWSGLSKTTTAASQTGDFFTGETTRVKKNHAHFSWNSSYVNSCFGG
jgi:hypothetical protein